MTAPSSGTDHSEIWQFVSLADYKPPPPDVVQEARRGLTSLWRRLRPDVEPTLTSPVKSKDALTSLPNWQLDRVAPPPAWAEVAQTLDAALGVWRSQPDPAQPIQVVVTPPHLPRNEILTAWAEQHGWRVVPPPSMEHILDGRTGWLSEQFVGGGPWVLPELERLYLRDAGGLTLVRAFLDQAHAGDLGHGLIGCDSWAWAYLGHVWHGWLPPTLTVQAFDETRLAALFRHLADTGTGSTLAFRQSDDGSDVIDVADTTDDAQRKSDFLHRLATYARGNPAVAWDVWRTALCSEPSIEVPQEAAGDREVADRTIWVTPWEELALPTVPPDAGREVAFVLHALLLHGGLPSSLLGRLLPLGPNQAQEVLDTMRTAGVVSRRDRVWKVAPSAYPFVREFLRSGGYLADAF